MPAHSSARGRRRSANAASSETSTVSGTSDGGLDDSRVHRMTLSDSGSPDATPSANRSRRSAQRTRDGCARLPAYAKEAPIDAAAARNARRVSARRDSSVMARHRSFLTQMLRTETLVVASISMPN
jgi:hypothetical protein